jgi:hypothetical protein
MKFENSPIIPIDIEIGTARIQASPGVPNWHKLRINL